MRNTTDTYYIVLFRYSCGFNVRRESINEGLFFVELVNFRTNLVYFEFRIMD